MPIKCHFIGFSVCLLHIIACSQQQAVNINTFSKQKLGSVKDQFAVFSPYTLSSLVIFPLLDHLTSHSRKTFQSSRDEDTGMFDAPSLSPRGFFTSSIPDMHTDNRKLQEKKKGPALECRLVNSCYRHAEVSWNGLWKAAKEWASSRREGFLYFF